MPVSDEDYKLPNVTVLWNPKKNASFGIYLGSQHVYSQNKGHASKPEVYFARLAQEGALPKKFRWRAYDAFPSTLASVNLNGKWPASATDLIDVTAKAGSLSVWSLE